jgi:hypothetical protein
LISDFAPTLLANGQVFAFYLNIEFNVFAIADIFPWVFTVFHVYHRSSGVAFFAFKRRAQATAG